MILYDNKFSIYEELKIIKEEIKIQVIIFFTNNNKMSKKSDNSIIKFFHLIISIVRF